MLNGRPTLGVDFGRVINDSASHPTGDDTTFLSGTEEDVLATPAMPGAFAALNRITDLFDGRVWVVSKAGPEVQAKTVMWLRYNKFFDVTGIPSNHLRFVRKRAEKRGACARIGVTHFIDDQVGVLQGLVGAVPHLYLFGRQEGPIPDFILSTPTWRDVELALEVLDS